MGKEHFIVTNGDEILCQFCYSESVNEQDPATHYFSSLSAGECSCCGEKLLSTESPDIRTKNKGAEAMSVDSFGSPQAKAVPSRADVLFAFSVEAEISQDGGPDSGDGVLNRYLRNYPQFAEDLLELSLELDRRVVEDDEPLAHKGQAMMPRQNSRPRSRTSEEGISLRSRNLDTPITGESPSAEVAGLRCGSQSATRLLSASEDSVVGRLADAWNEFIRLESVHPDHVTEFRRAIHAAQHIIMARPVQRQFNADYDAITGGNGA